MSVITAVALKTGHLQANGKMKLFPECILCFEVLGFFSEWPNNGFYILLNWGGLVAYASAPD